MQELSSPRPRLQGDVRLRAAECSGAGVSLRRECVSTIRYLVALIFLIVLPSPARPQEAPPSKSLQGNEYTIQVNVDMVVLHATVQNHKGVLVPGLDQNDFQVYEDGARQQIRYFTHEDIPVTVGLVVDNSGSMRPKRPEVIAAALAFARSSNPLDQMFVVNFNEMCRLASRPTCLLRIRWISCELPSPESPQMVRRRCTTLLPPDLST